ncbi:hypothetical protein C8F01DRAFT_1144724 [Mycena amicta]|nr:hypothetical protein C8F01DRAFT_1144724 [Mycena amicta]
MAMDIPHFPRELEQEILEIAAETWSQEVPKLLLVAHRVHLWLEPFLYRAIYLHLPSNPRRTNTHAQDAFLRIASSKHPSFLARGVRQVSVDFSGYEFDNPELVSQFTDALQHCTGITHLAMTGCERQAHKVFSILDLVRLRRLSGFLSHLMPSPIPMDARQPIFRSLTHLAVRDIDLFEKDPRCLPFLMTLPALTHLALRGHIPDHIVKALLQRDACMHLQVLVVLCVRAGMPISPIDGEGADVAGRLVGDPRLVMTANRVWNDSIFIQGHTFWHEADNFVQKKKLGLIPNDQYWTGNFYSTAV